MRQYDPNPGLSAFTVALGLVVGIAAGVALGLSAVGIVATAVAGLLLASVLASALGIVGERAGGRAPDDDLPPEYHDY